MYKILYIPYGEYLKVPYFKWYNENAGKDYEFEYKSQAEQNIKNLCYKYKYPRSPPFDSIGEQVVVFNNLLPIVLKEHFDVIKIGE